MLENVIEELTVVNGMIEIPFRAFEIKTIRLVKEEKYAKNRMSFIGIKRIYTYGERSR